VQRPAQLTPNKSPAHFWGAELRARRVDRGLSLEDLGRVVHRDRSYLAKIERGERPASAELARDCDRALGDDGTLIRLHAMVTAQQGAASGPHVDQRGNDVASAGPHVARQPNPLVNDAQSPAPLDEGEDISVPARMSDGRVVFVSVSRRVFLGGVGASAVAATAGVAPAPHLPAGGLALRTAVPDLNPVEHLAQMRKVLIDSDNIFGPAQVIPTVTQQIKLIRQLRQSVRGTDQRGLLHMQAMYAEFNGWLHQDHGNREGAEYWTGRALEWSHGAMDHELTVFILARKAQIAGDMGDPLAAIDLGSAAESMAPPNSRLAAVAATFTAHGYALQGDLDGTRRAYDHAHELREAMPADPASPWGVWLDAPYIDVARNRSMVLLGEYTEAAKGFEAAIAALPADFRRDRGVYLARAARAYAGAEDADHAADLGLQALSIGVHTQSGRILTELAHLDDSLAIGQQTPHVAEFRAAMAETLGRQV
jgi:hypothetical protein